MKKMVVFLLAVVLVLGVAAQDRLTRQEYTRTVRSQIFKANGNDSVPKQMGRVEYNQRTRAQIVKESEAADSIKLFPCLLINSKIGRNEKATFLISSTLVRDVPYSFTLNPQEECKFFLPAGEYRVEIFSAGFYRAHIAHIDPRKTHYVSGKTFYLVAEKYLSDF